LFSTATNVSHFTNPKCLLKSVPLQAWRCPEGSRKLRFPDYKAIAVPLNACSCPEGSRKLRFPDYKAIAVPLQDWSGPEGSRKLRIQHFVTTAQDGCR